MKPSSKRTLKKVFLNITTVLFALVLTGNVIAGENADAIVSALGTENQHTAKELVSPEENKACYYTLLSTEKAKQTVSSAGDAIAATASFTPAEDEPADEFKIVRSKRFSIKPMSAEEAILQMNLLDHEFFVFRNMDAEDAIAVVYKRRQGGYGLICDDGLDAD